MELRNRSGQVTTEYILLAAFLVTLLIAISGILNNFVEDAGKEIETRASAVMSQREMGIPLGWFFASVGGKLPGAGNPNAGGPGSGTNDGPVDRGLGPDGGAGDGPGASAGVDGPGGRGANAGLETGTNDATNAGNNGTGANGGNAGTNSGEEEGAEGRANRGRRGTTGGVIEVDDDSDADVSNQRENQEDVDKKDDDAERGVSVGADGVSRREFALTNESDRRKGTCEDFDIFRLLKILAIVALIVLGGAYLTSASGNRGGRKK